MREGKKEETSVKYNGLHAVAVLEPATIIIMLLYLSQDTSLFSYLCFCINLLLITPVCTTFCG